MSKDGSGVAVERQANVERAKEASVRLIEAGSISAKWRPRSMWVVLPMLINIIPAMPIAL